MRVGIDIERYDFSETQSGKGFCDTKIASMKSHVRIYVNEKHDVVFPEDLKAALESSGGIKGCRVLVVEVNGLKETGVLKWEGISFYSSFHDEEKGIHAWRGLFAYDDLVKEEQRETCLQVIQTFSCKTTLGSASFMRKANG